MLFSASASPAPVSWASCFLPDQVFFAFHHHPHGFPLILPAFHSPTLPTPFPGFPNLPISSSRCLLISQTLTISLSASHLQLLEISASLNLCCLTSPCTSRDPQLTPTHYAVPMTLGVSISPGLSPSSCPLPASDSSPTPVSSPPFFPPGGPLPVGYQSGCHGNH